MSRLDLRDKVVLITGPARGIGEHTARLLAARGARLALVGLEPDRLAKLAADLDDGYRHAWYECDVTDQAALERAVAATGEALGRLDVVVANAGIANLGTLATGSVDAAARTIEVNLIGVLRTIAATLPRVTAARGHYLLVSSAAAFAVLPGMAAYCAAKAGVEQLGNALRLEVAHTGVTVGTAHPIWIDTDLVRDAMADLSTFPRTLRKLPWPLNSVVPVNDCTRAFVDGIERRRRRIYVPRSIGLVQAARTLVLGPLGEAVVRRGAREAVPEMEEQVRALGRAFGEHSMGQG